MPFADHTARLHWVTIPTQQTNSQRSRSRRRTKPGTKIRTNVTYNVQGCHVHRDTIGSYDTFKTMKQLSEATKGHFGTDVGLRLDRKAGTDRSYDSANVADINGKIYHGHHYKTSGATTPRDRTLFINHGAAGAPMTRLIFKNAGLAEGLLHSSALSMTNGPAEMLIHIGEETERGRRVNQIALLVDRAVTMSRYEVESRTSELQRDLRLHPDFAKTRTSFILSEYIPEDLTEWAAKDVHISRMADGYPDQGPESAVPPVSVLALAATADVDEGVKSDDEGDDSDSSDGLFVRE